MEVIRNLDFQFNMPTAVTIGKFDGIHRGHLMILNKLWEYHHKELHTVVVTFDVSPLKVLTGETMQLLTTQQEKELVMEASGVDTMIVLPFTRELAAMTAEDFVKDMLVGRMNMKAIAVGEDCTFGYKAMGNAELLKQMSKECDFSLDVFSKVKYNDQIISSTLIKEYVLDGKVEEVHAMSRQPYFLYGNVSQAGGISHKFGYPYCVMNVPDEKIIPAAGLYYSKVMKDDVFYPSLSFVSPGRRLIGSYLFEADRDLGYDNISVGLFKFIRPPYPSVDPFHLNEKDLRDKFKEDIINAQKWHRENIYIPEDVC